MSSGCFPRSLCELFHNRCWGLVLWKTGWAVSVKGGEEMIGVGIGVIPGSPMRVSVALQ